MQITFSTFKLFFMEVILFFDLGHVLDVYMKEVVEGLEDQTPNPEVAGLSPARGKILRRLSAFNKV